MEDEQTTSEQRRRSRRRRRWQLLGAGLLLYLIDIGSARADILGMSGQQFSDWIFSVLKDWVFWLICYLADLIWPLIESTLELVPQEVAQDTGLVAEIFSYANYWVPLDLAFTLVLALLGFGLLYFIFNRIIRLIPGVS